MLNVIEDEILIHLIIHIFRENYGKLRNFSLPFGLCVIV